MAVTYTVPMPLSGGGLGNKKVEIISLLGTYATGGFSIALRQAPAFIAVGGAGYGAAYNSTTGLVQLFSGAVELAADTSVAGLELFVIL